MLRQDAGNNELRPLFLPRYLTKSMRQIFRAPLMLAANSSDSHSGRVEVVRFCVGDPPDGPLAIPKPFFSNVE